MSHRTDRRRRKKLREQIDLPPPPSPPLDLRGGRHGDMAIFADAETIQSDMRLVRRAIRDGWDIPEKMRTWLPEAIMEVVAEPLDKSGVDESTWDMNAVAAGQTILAMETANMRQQHAEIDRLLADRNSSLSSGEM